MTGARALAVWTGPALVAAAVAAVTVGAAAAPPLLVAAAVAPLLALLQPPRAPSPPHPVTLAVTALAAALVLWAHLALLADAAVLLGARRWQGIVLAAAPALLATLLAGTARWRGVALAAAGAALVFVLVAHGLASGIAPWTAWREAAARPALVFSARSVWVTAGERFVRGATLAFEEGHRVVAVTAGTFRAVEDDGARRVVRDWRLAAGDALVLRPGDTLAAEAGSRLRFEVGKRVPGAAASGAAWADAPRHASPAHALGVVVTLVLGAVALVPAGGRRAAGAPALMLAFALGAASWGVYTTLAAPEAGLAGSPADALLALPRALAPGARMLTPGVTLVALGLLTLFAAAADGLRDRVRESAGARWPGVWTAVMIAAGLAAMAPAVDPWTPLAAGLGLAGAALAAPRMAGADGARIGPWPASAVGAAIGGAVFVGMMALAARPAASLSALPVLAAAPAAWLLVKFLRRKAEPAR